MAEDNFTLTTFYASWKEYQDHIMNSLAPLTAEQLALRASPDLRSVGENAKHIIGCRIGWFTYTLGEDAGADADLFKSWDDSSDTLSAAELVHCLDRTWSLMTD